MKTSFSRKQINLAVACALALGFASGAVRAQNNTGIPHDKELWNNPNNIVWKSADGLCWQSPYGPPPAYGDCNPAPRAEYVAPPPPAPVVVAAAPPQAVYERVTLDANVLFDFDKSVLRPQGRDALDSFVSRIQGIGASSISAVGYADRFGTDAYNQALSERRVATVKSYLLSKGVEPTWSVHTDAKGELAPTTTPGQCTGEKNANTIACLQPDRHVFIEITGQRLKQ